MKGIARRRPSMPMVVGLAALVLAAGGVAFATIPDSGGTIHGCYQKGNGNLRVVEAAGDCRGNETAITWNQQGPPGPPGGSSVQKLPTMVLSDGDRTVLFTAGPLTFTAHCGVNVVAPGITSSPVTLAEVLVSTTQDHAGFTGSAGTNEDLATNASEAERRVQWSATLSSNGPRPLYQGRPFTATAPDGTAASGAL